MARLAVIVLVSTAVLSPACTLHRAETQKAPLSRCTEDLSTIPDAGVALGPRKPGEQPESASLEGLRVALTINGMLTSRVDPAEDLDDWCYGQNTRDNFNKLVGALKERQMPPTVLFAVGNVLDETLAQEWLREGNLVGNMTFSRRKLRRVTVAEFVEDIAKNDELLSRLGKPVSTRKRYFRYPNTKGYRDPAKQPEIAVYLRKQGYLEAPFTLRAEDGRYSQIYCSALARGDQSCANLIKAVFKSVLVESAARARTVGAKIAGHELTQVLAIGANQLICDTLGEILDQLTALGVRFISLDEALRDPFYSRDDVRDAARRIDRHTKRALQVEARQR